MSIKKITIYLAFLAIFGIAAASLFVNSSAQTPSKTAARQSKTPVANESPLITPSQPETNAPATLPEDVFSAGQTVEIKSESPVGDVALAGANVRINGKVQGYVMAAGANVNIDAPVGNDLWAAGANIVVNAPVADNALLAGSSVVLESNAVIGRDARIAAGFADVKGRVTRNLKIAASGVQISSEVGGNVVVYAENLTLQPGAIVRGDLIVNSPNQPVVSPQAQVLGRLEYRPTESNRKSGSSSAGGWFGSWFLTFLWMTILGLVVVWFSSVWTNRVADTLKRETGKSLLVGLVVALLAPVVFILLLVTVAGLPLAFILGAVSLVGFMLSGVFVSYLVGEWLLNQLKRWQTSDALKIVFGALIVTLVMSLPWIGGLAKLAVFFFGFGAFLLERRDLLRQLRERGLA